MMIDLAFFHTSPLHIASFESLLSELGVNIRREHVVDEDLLVEVQIKGEEGIKEKLFEALAEVLMRARVVLCTCSSLSPLAESCDPRIIRLDRAMAQKAVSYSAQKSSKLALIATLGTTLDISSQLILEEAAKADFNLKLDSYLIPQAWQAFSQGEVKQYQQCIRDFLAGPRWQAYDALVLAQASMAAAFQDEPSPYTLFSSPRLGLEAALDRLNLPS
ncbi:MAG: hypothetical protein R2880_20050 [Deinococcales bacterium]